MTVSVWSTSYSGATPPSATSLRVQTLNIEFTMGFCHVLTNGIAVQLSLINMPNDARRSAE